MIQESLAVSKADFWNNKYINKEFTWDTGSCTPIFRNWSDSITNKKNIKICIPGCGRGHDVIYLSKQGLDVYAFDFSIEAISYLKSQNNQNNLNANIFCMDFFDLSKKYNVFFDYILEYTFYCAINPKDREKYINKCHDILNDKGKLIAIMLPLAESTENNGPPFYVSKEELINKFDDKFSILKMEKSNLSISKRKDIEIYVEYEKK